MISPVQPWYDCQGFLFVEDDGGSGERELMANNSNLDDIFVNQGVAFKA